MKYPSYNPQEIEPAILKFWQENKTVDHLRERNKIGKKFYFLDGPPYTSGKFHLGHAWNYALKDFVLRYKRMKGFNVWDRNGFDVHGLPTEHKVMAKHNLDTKEDIEKFGVDKFVTECQDFCLEMADVMTKDLVRMGVTFDLSNPYMALKTEFMEGEWDLIKKAYEKNLLYYGEKVLTWCQHCETAVAKHECEYKNVNEKSIFVKFPVKDKENEFIIIWTTTPWTIPFNLAVMVGPELDYVKANVEGEKWIIAKALAGVVIQAVANKEFTIEKEFKGKELEGLEYNHPFEIKQYEELKKDHPNVHTVILSEEYVDTSAGSGLVHSAPGCGPEDQEACKPYDIPPFNELGEDGFFSDKMGKFSGLRAKVDDEKFIAALEEAGSLVAVTNVEHEYPHCWRCKNPIVFRITYQWFFKIEEIKKRILEKNKDVHWVPETSLNSYEAWVKNLKDNSISRQRYWGTPVPIWKCSSCEEIKVISSKKEIEENGGTPPDNIHIPWINEVKLDCSCGKKMDRVPDVIDVWVDAGTASWNCLDNDPQKMQDWFPADAILEAKEQTRLWFSMLSICSEIYLEQKSYKNVYVYGMLNDIEGKKMSKSIGNIISPYELIDKHGVDVLRYYMCQNNAGQDINFSWDECTVKQRNLNILWNLHKLLINLSMEHQINPFEIKDVELQHEEHYIFSKLNQTIKNVTLMMEKYELDRTIAPLEELYLELSRTYVQIVREKSAVGSDKEKKTTLYTIANVLLDFLKMFNVISPFISEAIYQNLREEFNLKEASISHYLWPEHDEDKINPILEEQMKLAQDLIASSLHAREKAKLSVRWPVKEIIVDGGDDAKNVINELKDIITKQVNVKEISVRQLEGVKEEVTPNRGAIGKAVGKYSKAVIEEIAKGAKAGHKFMVDNEELEITKEMFYTKLDVPEPYVAASCRNFHVYLDTTRTPELDAEGFTREIARQVQSLRKKAGLHKKDRVKLWLLVNDKLKEYLKPYNQDLKEKVGADEFIISTESTNAEYDLSEEFSVKGEKCTAWLSKI